MKDARIMLNETAIKNRSRKAVSETNITLSDWISNELFIALGNVVAFLGVVPYENVDTTTYVYD